MLYAKKKSSTVASEPEEGAAAGSLASILKLDEEVSLPQIFSRVKRDHLVDHPIAKRK